MPYGRSREELRLSFDDLPLQHGEEGKEWNNLMARYGHHGCPGIDYEDVCAEPWECASKGTCRITHNKRRDILLRG